MEEADLKNKCQETEEKLEADKKEHEEVVASKDEVIKTLQSEIEELRQQQNEKLEAYVT